MSNRHRNRRPKNPNKGPMQQLEEQIQQPLFGLDLPPVKTQPPPEFPVKGGDIVPQRFDRTFCKHCHEPIRFITTRKGAKMPVEDKPFLRTHDGGHVIKNDPDYPGQAFVQVYSRVLWVPHWIRCAPSKEEFEKARLKKR